MREAAGYLRENMILKVSAVFTRIVKSSVRTIYDITIERDGDIITLRISGNGFLYNMVRIIAGTLINVGERRMAAGKNKRNSGVGRPWKSGCNGSGQRTYIKGYPV